MLVSDLEDKVDAGDLSTEKSLVDKLLYFIFRSGMGNEQIEHLRINQILEKAKRVPNTPSEILQSISRVEKKLGELHYRDSRESSGAHDSDSSSKNYIKRSKHEHRGQSKHHHDHGHESGSKYSGDSKYQKKKINTGERSRKMLWAAEPEMTNIKYFRASDEPNRNQLSEEELQASQKQGVEGSDLFENRKHNEALEEGKRRKESEKEIENQLDSMKEEIKWSVPALLSSF